MNLFNISCLLSIVITTVISWDGYHRQPDDEMPPISWKECGISVRDCDPNSTFKDPFVSSRIWGGEYASTGEYPYFAYFDVTFPKKIAENVFKLSEGVCGGAILNEWWIMTAAHCLLKWPHNRGENQTIQISIGSINRYVGRYLNVERVVMQSIYMQIFRKNMYFVDRFDKLGHLIKFNQIRDANKTFINQLINEWNGIRKEESNSQLNHQLWDIALVKVKHRIVPVFNKTHYKINSICLPKTGILNTLNESAVIMGMGLNKPNGKASHLKKGITITLNSSLCDEIYSHKLNTKHLICILRLNNNNKPLLNSSTCVGDSGSPLLQYYNCQAIQLGIVSHGASFIGQCNQGYQWLTRVSLFMPWIRSVILSNDIIVISQTNIALILSVITTAIIAVVVSFALLFITVLTSKRRPQQL